MATAIHSSIPRTKSPPLHPPVPNRWIIDHKLDILDNNVLNEDPDGTGFTVLDDWKNVKGDGSDSIDPQDKSVHPPYWTKLRSSSTSSSPSACCSTPTTANQEAGNASTFQINTVDVQQPSQFVKIGDTINGTKFKVISFEYKTAFNPRRRSTNDVSELTVQNTESGDNVVLVLGKIADSPDSYALFRYSGPTPSSRSRRSKEFVLLPEASLRYKLIDITETDALIQTPHRRTSRVPRVEQHVAVRPEARATPAKA